VTARILVVLGTDAADDALAQRMDDALAETAWVIDQRAYVVREWKDGDEDDEGVEGLHFDVAAESPPGVTTGPGDYLRTDGGTWQALGYAICYEGLREITERAWDTACAGPADDRD